MDDSQTEAYLLLLARHERELASYVYGLVGSRADGDEILQEARVLMWKKFVDFTPGTNFAAWGRKICLGLILNYRRSRQRERTTAAEDAFIEAVASEIDRIEAESAGLPNNRAEALEACLKKLPETHRQIILWRYYEDLDIPGIARKSRRSEGAVYRMLSRVRKTLLECMEKELGASHG